MKSGTVAVIGRANAGKSTLVNVLVGEKIAIVSPKPQTTRDRIMGICNRENAQIVFIDTPGLYRQFNALTDAMMKTTEDTAKEVDAIAYVLDAHAGMSEEDISLVLKYQGMGLPMLTVLTKIDIMPAKDVPAAVKALADAGVQTDIYPVSARKGKNLKKLEEGICALLPEGEPLYPDDIVSDRSEKFMVAELMREKILLKYEKEIPHGVAVIVHTFEKKGGMYEVGLDIICEKKSHKAILIGKGCAALKEASSFARQSMEKFLGAKVYLTTYVKVVENWRDRQNLLKSFGY